MAFICIQFILAGLLMILAEADNDELNINGEIEANAVQKQDTEDQNMLILPYWEPEPLKTSQPDLITEKPKMKLEPNVSRRIANKNFLIQPINKASKNQSYRQDTAMKLNNKTSKTRSYRQGRRHKANVVPVKKSVRQRSSIELSNDISRKQSFYRGKHLEPIVRWSSHEDVETTTTQRQVHITKKNKNYSSGKHKPLRQNMKMKQVESDDRDAAKSTRVAPLQMMQQEASKKKVVNLVQAVQDENKVHNEPVHEYNKDNKKKYPYTNVLNAYTVEEQISELLSEFKDAEFTTEILGRTASYIDIVLFKISQRGSKYFRTQENKYVENEPKEKKILFIVHALSPMGLGHSYSLTLGSHLILLLSNYMAHLDKFDIYLIPLANPDGYQKVKKVTYWNKNLVPNAQCPGVDVDRNFDVAWNVSHQQMSSCAQHFQGAAPFSEAESRAVRDVFHKMGHKIAGYFHVHAGTYKMYTFKGDAVLYPKGYTDQQSDDDKYIDLRGEIDEAIKNANFKVISVTVDTLYSWYGKVSGTSVDYAATVYGIPFAMELVMQLYEDADGTSYDNINKLGANLTTLESYSIREIWKRVIDVIFTNIYKKLEGNEGTRLL